VDGNLLPPLTYPAEAFIKGDGRVLSIAAASIIAK
jgi:ribonuclease HII